MMIAAVIITICRRKKGSVAADRDPSVEEREREREREKERAGNKIKFRQTRDLFISIGNRETKKN